MTKKILLIIGIILIIGAVAFFLFNKPEGEDGEGGFSFGDFLPFGRSSSIDESGLGKKDEFFVPSNNNTKIPRLRKISSEPVAGSIIFNTGSTSVVRFVEKGTGNVYEAKSDSVAIERLTNTTIPKIIRAFWLKDLSGFISQTLIPESEIVDTSFVQIKKVEKATSTENLTPFEIKISKLPIDIKEIALEPIGKKIFYYTTEGLNSNWFISNKDGTQSKLVNTSPLTEWLPFWISEGEIILQTKSSFNSTSHLYSFNTKQNVLRKTGTGVVGLSANPEKNGLKTLISNGGSFPNLFVMYNKTASFKEVKINTLAEKCIWSEEESNYIYCATPEGIPEGAYPDDWYKGKISTNDSIKKIDTENDIHYNIIDLERESGEKIDAYDISISPDEKYLTFKNKNDGFLWLLKIEED